MGISLKRMKDFFFPDTVQTYKDASVTFVAFINVSHLSHRCFMVTDSQVLVLM